MPSSLPTFVTYALSAVGAYKYPLLFIGTAIEGPLLMIACGFLLHYNAFSIFPLFLALVGGDLAGDIAWYYIGKYYAHSFIEKRGHLFHITPELFEKGKSLFQQYHVKILIISKVTIGFGMAIATLMAAGATRVSMKTFLTLNIIGEIILVVAMLGIGYWFGSLYNTIAEGFKIVFLVGAGLVAAIAIYGFARFMKHKIAHL